MTRTLGCVSSPLGRALWHVFQYGFERGWYAMEYRAAPENVTIYTQPHNCEFWTAPIGSKHCHFETTVKAVTENGQQHVVVSWIMQHD